LISLIEQAIATKSVTKITTHREKQTRQCLYRLFGGLSRTYGLNPEYRGKYVISNFFRSSGHIFEEFVKPSPSSDDASLVGVGLLAYGLEIGTIAPVISDLDHLLFDTVDIIVLHKNKATSVICILHSWKTR
jgi:hypothetical protein